MSCAVLTAKERLQMLQQRLEASFSPYLLHIEDESWKHAGHAGAREQGGGHYIVSIRAASLDALPRLARHRAIQQAVSDLYGPVIHALSLRFPEQ